MTDFAKEARDLRLLAEKATAGPWHGDKYNAYIWGPKREMVADSGGVGLPDGAIIRARGAGGGLPIADNMAYVAAANPTAILRLLDEIERAKAEGFQAGLAKAAEIARDFGDLGTIKGVFIGDEATLEGIANQFKKWTAQTIAEAILAASPPKES